MARPSKARVEGAEAPKAEKHGVKAALEKFKADYPDEWEALRLVPFQHGIEVMIERLD